MTRLPEVHCDPFDRLLDAQSVTGPLVRLANDEIVARYPAAVRLV